MALTLYMSLLTRVGLVTQECFPILDVVADWHNLYLVYTIKLARRAGSMGWLYVSWTSQLDVCSTFARCLLGVCSIV